MSRLAAAAALGALLALLVAPRPAQAQRPSGWSAMWENDSFALFGGSDRNYTNGVRLVWGVRSSPRRTLRGDRERDWGRLAWVGAFHSTTSSWTLGQNFFTPSTITVFHDPPDDRPYAGLAYGGIRLDATGLPSRRADPLVRPPGFSITRRHSVEVNVGILGAAAGARVFQTFAHVLRESRIPKGWKNQVPHEPFVGVGSVWRARAGWHFLDLTPHLGAHLSTVQAYPYAGATLRLGFNMSDFPSLLIRNTAVPEAGQRPDWEISVVTGVEGRVMAYNAFVEGGLRSDSEGVPAETLVGDWRLGVSVRLTDWRLSWTRVRRSPELEDDGRFRRYHDYGSVTFAYEPGRRTAADREGTVLGAVEDWLGCIFGGFLLEAATGPADAKGAAGALGSRLSVSKRFGDKLAVGGEVVGMGREFGPPPLPGGDHEDLFLVNKMLTLRWMPFATLGPGRLHLRGGAGAGLRKLQVTPAAPGPRPVADPCPDGTFLESDDRRYCNGRREGTGLMLGAGYWFGLPGDQASLGIDYAWNTIRLADDADPQFAVVTLGFQWHPS